MLLSGWFARILRELTVCRWRRLVSTAGRCESFVGWRIATLTQVNQADATEFAERNRIEHTHTHALPDDNSENCEQNKTNTLQRTGELAAACIQCS